MENPPKRASEILDTDDAGFSILWRYTKSDRITTNVDAVVKTNLTPLAYARRLTKEQGIKLFDTVFADESDKVGDMPKDIKLAWVFDRALDVAVANRVTYLHNDKWEESCSFLAWQAIHPLLIMPGEPKYEWYMGLTEFEPNVRSFLRYHTAQLQTVYADLIEDFVSTLCVAQDHRWPFHRKVWQKTFEKNFHHMRVLRYFLHEVLVSFITTDDILYDKVGIIRSRINKCARWFIDLVGNPDTTEEELLRFITQIRDYDDGGYHQPLSSLLYEGPFVELKEFYEESFTPLQKQTELTEEERDHPLWTFLRDLGDTWSPENVISKNMSAYRYATMFVDTFIPNDHDSVIKPLADILELDVPDDIGQLSDQATILFKAFIKDQIALSLIDRKLCHYSSNNASDRDVVVTANSHSLLVLKEARGDWFGLSLVYTALDFHLEAVRCDMAHGEYVRYKQFLEAWDYRYDRIEDFSLLLHQEKLVDDFRQFLFTVIESVIAIPDKQHDKYMEMERQTFYSCVEEMSVLLTSDDVNPRKLAALIRSVPTVKRCVFLNTWTSSIWGQLLDIIPISE